MFLPSPAFVISHAAPEARAMNSSMCGSMITSLLTTSFGGHVDVPGNTTRGVAYRIRAYRALSWRDRRGRAFLERIGGLRLPRASEWQTNAGAGADGHEWGRGRPPRPAGGGSGMRRHAS